MKQTIKEVKEILATIDNVEDPYIQECLKDERKGVQTALKQWHRHYKQQAKLVKKFQHMSQYEDEAREKGYKYIAGIDEVGRGPLAGPVVAASVILDDQKPILGLDDSKKLSSKKREELFKEINEKAIAISIGMASAAEIDQYNILQATKIAMNRAIKELNPQADFLLVDALHLESQIPQLELIKGDSKSNSIAAASIIAKVTRDRLMIEQDKKYPGYGFSNNAGYGTKAHLSGLEQHGPSPIHRRSFAPVKKYF